jgi:hypothetical protein
MLSSIHPLGERARHNRWAVTVVAFTASSTVVGAGMGAALGWAGSWLPERIPTPVQAGLIAAGALVAGIFDLRRNRPPGPKRQVNEHWIGTYRGWVYGGAFGAQLGAGVATYVVTWGVYAVFLTELLLARPAAAAAVGGAFGFGRALAPIAAGWIDRPSRLSAFHGAMARLGPPVHRVTASSLAVVGAMALIGSFS